MKIKAEKMCELEKFGFVKYHSGSECNYSYKIYDYCGGYISLSIGSNRVLIIEVSSDDDYEYSDNLKIFYDLIKADMVEE